MMESHRFDVLSFSFGLVYLLLGLLFLVPATPTTLVSTLLASTRWLWPLVILGLGAAIVIPLVRTRSTEEDPLSTD